MASITVGSIEDFSIVSVDENSNTSSVDRFSTLSNGNEQNWSRTEFYMSDDRRGVALQSLRLMAGYQNFFQRLFDLKSKIYFLAWAWDMKGVHFYPGELTLPSTCLIPIKGNDVREFIGHGTLLFPSRQVVAGISLRVNVWESKQGKRKFGETMKQVSQAIQSSELNAILATVAAGVTGGGSLPISAIQTASLELAGIVGGILEKTSDKFVDYFEGYFPAGEPWGSGDATYLGDGCSITLRRFS